MLEAACARHVLIVENGRAMQDRFASVVRALFPAASVYCRSSLEEGERVAKRLERLDVALLSFGALKTGQKESAPVFRQKLPHAKVVVVSGPATRASVLEAFEAGAWAYVPAGAPDQVLRAALLQIDAGWIWVPPQVLASIRKARPLIGDVALVNQLTERQLQILRLKLDDMTNAEIAEDLEISTGTVKQHLYAIYKTLGVSNRGELFRLARSGKIRGDGSPIRVPL